MKTALLGLAASAAALSCPLPATAAETLEVKAQPSPVERAALIANYGPIGQSFTAFTDTLSAVQFQFKTFNTGSANSPINLSLFAGESLSGSALFSTTFSVPTAMSTATWAGVVLPEVAVTQGQKYTFVLSTSSFRNAIVIGPGYTYSDPAFPNGRQVGGDAYTGGKLLSGSSIYPECNGAANNCDLNFRITGNLVAAAVPEPGAWAMMIVGFLAVGGAMRGARARRPQLNYV